MKTLLIAILVAGFAISSFADIQDPPSNDYGPTRKLGRGISNLAFGVSELPVTIAKINQREGNAAAAGYGVVRGLGRERDTHLLGTIRIPDVSVLHNALPLLPTSPERHPLDPRWISGVPTRARKRIKVSLRADVLIWDLGSPSFEKLELKNTFRKTIGGPGADRN